MEWTEEAISRLRALWAEGHSTAEIGRRMGISKNAVVGKAHRLELPPRPSPIRREGQSPRLPRRAAPRRVSGPTLPSLAGPSPVRPAGVVAPRPEHRLPEHRLPEHRPPEHRSTEHRSPEHRLLAPGEPRHAAAHDTAERPTAGAPPAAEARPAVRPVTVNPGYRSGRQLPCCWPIGEPGTAAFRFCDGDALAGKPYCGEHAALAYVKVRDRREEAA